MRRLAYRVSNMLRDQGPKSLEMLEFASNHPITMKLLLERLKKDNDEVCPPAPPVPPLLGPGDPE
jgi:hypothetical protein